MSRARQRNYGCRIVEYTIEGLQAIALENRSLRVGILVEKGADIYEFLYKPCDVDPLWRSLSGIVHPARGVASISSRGGAFMDVYEGGWQELFPTLGPSVVHLGAEFGEHGEVALLPWTYDVLYDSPDEVRVALRVRTRRTPFVLQRIVTLRGDRPVLWIEEQVTNEGAETVSLWRTLGPSTGYPWYGRTYTLGLEPFSSVPPHAEDAAQAGTLLQLEAGQTLTTTLMATAFECTGPVTKMDVDGTIHTSST